MTGRSPNDEERIAEDFAFDKTWGEKGVGITRRRKGFLRSASGLGRNDKEEGFFFRKEKGIPRNAAGQKPRLRSG